MVVGMYANRSKGWEKQGEFPLFNLDYIVLGLVIEAVTRSHWYLNIQNRILDPCRMGETGFCSFGNYPAIWWPVISPTRKAISSLEPEYHINFFSAGCMYSTAATSSNWTRHFIRKADEEAPAGWCTLLSPALGYVSYGTWVYPVSVPAYNLRNWWKDVVAFSKFSVCVRAIHRRQLHAHHPEQQRSFQSDSTAIKKRWREDHRANARSSGYWVLMSGIDKGVMLKGGRRRTELGIRNE